MTHPTTYDGLVAALRALIDTQHRKADDLFFDGVAALEIRASTEAIEALLPPAPEPITKGDLVMEDGDWVKYKVRAVGEQLLIGFNPATGMERALTKSACRGLRGTRTSEMEWYCEADAVGITTTHCKPASPIHADPCGWYTVHAATESSVSPACVDPNHWFYGMVGRTHDGGLPEDPRTPCVPPRARRQPGSPGDRPMNNNNNPLGMIWLDDDELRDLRRSTYHSPLLEGTTHDSQ